MSILEARNITKTFPGVKALDEVVFEVHAGEINCLVGENGAGKSTLIKILTGVYEADGGEIILEGEKVGSKYLHNSPKIAYVPQELNLFEELTIYENLFAPYQKSTGFLFNSNKYYEEAVEYLDRLKLDLDPYQKVKNVSVADKQLLQIGRALIQEEFEILILDEPTAALTDEEVERLFLILKDLREEGVAIVFISHILEEVLDIGDRVTVLRNGKLRGFSKIEKIDEDWIVERMTGEQIDFDKTFKPQISPGEEILKVKSLTGPGFEDVSFALKRGEILGIAGLVGAGRSELLQAIFGYLPVYGGEIEFEGKSWKFGDPAYSISRGLLYLPEERKSQGIMSEQSVRNNIGILHTDHISNLGVINEDKNIEITDSVIEDYDIKTASQETRIKFLSGGNQQKVLIGRSMKAEPKVLIFDEPTKGIDVNVKEEVFELMKELAENKGVGIIFVSSELEEVLKCSNRIMTLHEGNQVDIFKEGEISEESVLSSVIGIEQKTDQQESEVTGLDD